MKNLLRGTALATLLASCILLAPGSQAQTSSFIAATCGSACSDPLGEETAARSNWTTMTALGTTQYVGAAFNGGTIDASSLLAASRVAGPVVLDTYLRTGQAPDSATAQAILNALGITGIDVSGITGLSQSGSNTSYGGSSNINGSSSGDNSSSMLTQLANVLSGNTNGQFGSAGSASNVACDESIASATVAAAQQHINNMVTIATSGDYGFSQNGGSAVSSGQRSQSGYFGSSCLDTLMQGNRDLLFRPPQLSQLLSQLQGMFGGGGSGGSSGGGSGSSGGSGGSSGSSGNCANAPAILQQVMSSMPSGIFSGKGNGGFFPHLGFGGGEGTSTMNAFGLTSNVSRASTSSTGGIATLFSR